VDKIAVLNGGRLMYFGARDAVLAELNKANAQQAQVQQKQNRPSISLDDSEE
jgi:lipase B